MTYVLDSSVGVKWVVPGWWYTLKKFSGLPPWRGHRGLVGVGNDFEVEDEVDADGDLEQQDEGSPQRQVQVGDNRSRGGAANDPFGPNGRIREGDIPNRQRDDGDQGDVAI